jgi:hypothetical protein
MSLEPLRLNLFFAEIEDRRVSKKMNFIDDCSEELNFGGLSKALGANRRYEILETLAGALAG